MPIGAHDFCCMSMISKTIKAVLVASRSLLSCADHRRAMIGSVPNVLCISILFTASKVYESNIYKFVEFAAAIYCPPLLNAHIQVHSQFSISPPPHSLVQSDKQCTSCKRSDNMNDILIPPLNE